MFQNSWSLKLPQQPHHLTIAKLPNSSFVYQGNSNQLSVSCNNHIENLPIRKQVLALSTIQQSLILILTKYSLSCYDLLNNQQKFNIQFDNAEKLYVFTPKIYVVSRSSLYCYTLTGQQLYVNHVSSNITAITTVQQNNAQDSDETVICTEDMNMCRYNRHNIVFDYAKITEYVNVLCWIGKGVMVGTNEGSIAYYEAKKYKWRAKSAHSVQNIIKFQQISAGNKNTEFVNKNADKIVIVRRDGNIEIKDFQSGKNIQKIKLGQNIIHSFCADFRNEGINQIICCLQSGTISAFNIKDESQPTTKSTKPLKTDTTFQIRENEDKLEDLNKIKQDLIFNISELKNNLDNYNKQQISNESNTDILNPNFKINAKLQYKDGLILTINSENGYLSGITFEQPIMPLQQEKTTCLHYKFNKDNKIFGDIICEVIAHSISSNMKYQVKKFKISIPKFWKWGFDQSQTTHHNISLGRLKFKLIERNARYIMWIKQCFLLTISQKQKQKMQQQLQLKFKFTNNYQQKYLQIKFIQKQGSVEICCNCIKIMGEIFQDLINFIGIKNLNSQLIYPQEKQKIKLKIESIEKLQQSIKQLTIDLTQFINTIKFLLIKCEYLRQLNQISKLKKTYIQIQEKNKNLILEIEKKNKNQLILNQQLTHLNNFINSIANLRYGQPKNQVINRCMDAIKKKIFPDIYCIMDKGVDIQ